MLDYHRKRLQDELVMVVSGPMTLHRPQEDIFESWVYCPAHRLSDSTSQHRLEHDSSYHLLYCFCSDNDVFKQGPKSK